MTKDQQAREKAKEIGLWLYGHDEVLSEGLVRTLIDKITEAILIFSSEQDVVSKHEFKELEQKLINIINLFKPFNRDGKLIWIGESFKDPFKEIIK